MAALPPHLSPYRVLTESVPFLPRFGRGPTRGLSHFAEHKHGGICWASMPGGAGCDMKAAAGVKGREAEDSRTPGAVGIPRSRGDPTRCPGTPGREAVGRAAGPLSAVLKPRPWPGRAGGAPGAGGGSVERGLGRVMGSWGLLLSSTFSFGAEGREGCARLGSGESQSQGEPPRVRSPISRPEQQALLRHPSTPTRGCPV